MSLIVEVTVNNRDTVGTLAITRQTPPIVAGSDDCAYIAYLYLDAAAVPEYPTQSVALTHKRSDGAWVLIAKALHALGFEGK